MIAWTVRLLLALIRRRAGAILASSVLLTIGAGWLAAGNTFDHELRDLLPQAGIEIQRYDEFQKVFGADDDLLLGFATGRCDLDSMRTALRLRRLVASMPGVEGVLDLPTLLRIESEADLERLAGAPRLQDRLLGSLARHPLLVGLLTAPDASAQALVVRLAPGTGREKQQLVRELRERLAARLPDLPVHLAGYQVFGERYLHHLHRNNRAFISLSLVVALIVSRLLIGSWRIVAAVLGAVTMPTVWLLGLYRLLGFPLTMFSILLTPIVIFIGLSLSLQFLARCRHGAFAAPGPDPSVDQLATALTASLPPATLCCLTTLTGFATQLLSPVPGVRAFGLFAALGSLLALPATHLLLPTLLRALRPGPAAFLPPAWERRFRHWLIRRPGRRPVLFGFLAALAGLAAAGIPTLGTGRDHLESLPADDPATIDHRFFTDRFGSGGRTISLICTPRHGTWEEAANARALASLGAALARLDGVARVTGPDGLLGFLDAELSTRDANPYRSDAHLGRLLRLGQARAPGALAAVLNPPYLDRARLALSLRRGDAFSVMRVVAAVRAELARSDTIAGEVTGRMFLAALIEQESIAMELASFAGTLLVVLVTFGLAFRQLRAVLTAGVANLLPIGAAMGLLGLLGTPVDATVAMIPALTLGLIVDDTIHLLHAFRQRLGQGQSPRRCRVGALFELGGAVAATSLILMIGTGLLGLSPFAPVRAFGGATALVLFLAVLTDLWLTPWLALPAAGPMPTDPRPG